MGSIRRSSTKPVESGRAIPAPDLAPLSPPPLHTKPVPPIITKNPACRPSGPPARKRPLQVESSPAKKRVAFPAENYGLPTELGECIHRDIELLERVGWQHFVKERRNGGDLADLSQVDDHPARRLLMLYKNRGVPVKFSSPKWSPSQIRD